MKASTPESMIKRWYHDGMSWKTFRVVYLSKLRTALRRVRLKARLWNYTVTMYDWDDSPMSCGLFDTRRAAFSSAMRVMKRGLEEGHVSIGDKSQRAEVERVWFPYNSIWRTRKLIRTYEAIF